ncbi:MAG: phage terminase large subunit [Caldilineaceae bacterium]|nr:phage terminase large subunit [Caldilineaceae bacterium]
MTSSLPFSKAEIAAELLRRKRATEGLIEFTEFTFPRYRTADHHRKIAHHLERVIKGECKRLMLLLPPRHGKSELASKRFPALALGWRPELQFISASATSGLAEDFGRDVRNIISSAEYANLFPRTELAQDSQAKGKWNTSAGGIYYAVGVGGAVIGRGADIFLIDDPYASMADAQSETTRKNVYEWYTGTVYNRLQPGGAIVLINHRMHEADLTGSLLAQAAAGGDEWDVVEMPAIDENGGALWADAYPVEVLDNIRRNTIPRFWSALYQQNPVPDDGDYFKKDWFKWYTEVPKHLRTYGASDYAVTADGGDYTVHAVVGVDPEDNLYVLDIWRAQSESHIWIDAFIDLVAKWKPLNWAEETGQIIKSLGPFIVKRMRERRVYCRREQIPSAADKPTRSRSFQARAAMGKVYLPHNAPWIADLLAEMVAFPAGKHDDQVDTLGLVGRLLDQMVGGRGPRPDKPEKSRWQLAFERRHREGLSRGSSWKAA